MDGTLFCFSCLAATFATSHVSTSLSLQANLQSFRPIVCIIKIAGSAGLEYFVFAWPNHLLLSSTWACLRRDQSQLTNICQGHINQGRGGADRLNLSYSRETTILYSEDSPAAHLPEAVSSWRTRLTSSHNKLAHCGFSKINISPVYSEPSTRYLRSISVLRTLRRFVATAAVLQGKVQ